MQQFGLFFLLAGLTSLLEFWQYLKKCSKWCQTTLLKIWLLFMFQKHRCLAGAPSPKCKNYNNKRGANRASHKVWISLPPSRWVCLSWAAPWRLSQQRAKADFISSPSVWSKRKNRARAISVVPWFPVSCEGMTTIAGLTSHMPCHVHTNTRTHTFSHPPFKSSLAQNAESNYSC